MSGPDIRFSMFLDPDDLIRAWELRGDLKPSVRWHEMMHEDHAANFTVAKVAQLDLLRSIRSSLDQAIREGRTFEAWRDDLVPELRKAGWWGAVTDAEVTGTNERVIVNERRLQTIFRTNVRMSQAAGRWAKIQREKERFPYLRYLSDHPRKKPRRDHRSWHGVILPVDHPWWQTHFPPNGWGCGCHYEQLTEAGMKARGFTISTPPDDGPPRAFFAAAREGPIMVPRGIHPGFGYNPGTAHLRAIADKATQSIRRAAEAGLTNPARQAVRDIVADPAFDQFLALPDGQFPVAVLTKAERALMNARSPLVVLPTNVYRKQRGEMPSISRGHPELNVEDYRALPYLIERALLVARDGDTKLIYFSSQERLYKVVVRQDDQHELPAIVSFHASNLRKIEGETRRLEIIYDGRE